MWPSSYSSNTNEILWGAKAAARITHSLERYARDIIEKKKAAMAPDCPLLKPARGPGFAAHR